MIRIVILGNSRTFNQAFFSFLSPSLQSTNSIRFIDKIVEYELICGYSCGGCDRTNSSIIERFCQTIWSLEALNAHGIIFAHSYHQPDRLTIPATFYEMLKEKFGRPAVLISDNFPTLEGVQFERFIEVNTESGENCQLALLAIIYLINKRS